MPNYIDIEDNGRIRTIAINRADKRNALNADVVAELQQAFDAAEADDSVRVVVLTGRGGVFCAGADLAYLQQINENSVLENAEDSRQLMRLMYSIRTSTKATIARVNGHAIAGGCGLALTCDILVSVEDAKFGFTEVRIGFVPAIVMKLLMERSGMGVARELLIRGNLVDAAVAKEYRMVNHVVSEERLDETVTHIAREIATETSPQAVAMTKRLMRDVASRDIEDAMSLAYWQNAISRATPDFRTGVNSFLSKSKPDWK
ncbi:MAG: enoyl-CoA hydratase/isomerase family protein [Bacteroidetes bacterium]|nr:enoyl-CoA hydratase/isomerase family protein [Bacteroidota bacterium]